MSDRYQGTLQFFAPKVLSLKSWEERGSLMLLVPFPTKLRIRKVNIGIDEGGVSV